MNGPDQRKSGGLPEIEAKFFEAKLSEAWPQRVKN